MSETVFLGLGANLGDRQANLTAACRMLNESEGVCGLQKSALYETAPWGRLEQPPFLNAVICFSYEHSPQRLLARCQEIEAALGRRREPGLPWGPRTLDIDILLFGALQMQTPELTIPHPYLCQRAFVLAPLGDLAPKRWLPGIGSVEAALAGVDAGGVQKIAPPGAW